jgi:hypothetical protein
MDNLNTSNSNELAEVLRHLALAIKEATESGISNGTIQPEDEVYFRWKVDKFQYTDKGITESGAHGDYIPKRSWFRGTIKLQESLKQSNEYSSAFEPLTRVFGNSSKVSQGLERFTGRLISQHLSESKPADTDVELLITNFLKDLHEEPVKYGAEVELQGIILQMDRVVLPVFGVTLRQPRVEDLEKEFPAYGFMVSRFLPNPSAILNIEFLGRTANEIQAKVEQAVAILRLFKVGSVKWESYRMYSDSLTDTMASGTLTSGKIGAALETYLLTKEAVPRLKKFWQGMTDSLPKSLFRPESAKVDHVTIAYNHYSNALLENGSLEKRIANSVMGLEALLLKPGEAQELVYRLGLRLSKLLMLLGFSPYEVRRVMSDAYKVRNLFAHGGRLGYPEKKKLDSRYDAVHNLLLSVLDYLRTTLIAMILSSREKEEFIDLIEDSLLDRKKEEQLVTAISRAKEIVENNRE